MSDNDALLERDAKRRTWLPGTLHSESMGIHGRPGAQERQREHDALCDEAHLLTQFLGGRGSTYSGEGSVRLARAAEFTRFL